MEAVILAALRGIQQAERVKRFFCLPERLNAQGAL
jgi:hypothetical protein